MQLTEYLIWSDINCNNGLNKLAGYIGPLLNNLQPSLIYLLYYDELKKNNVINTVNIVYIFYNLYKYINFINNKNICSGLLNNHISWSWSYNSFNFYFIIMILNFYYLKKDDYVKISIILSIISYIVSYKYFKTNLGEFWCLFVVLIPIILLTIQRINIIRKKYYQ